MGTPPDERPARDARDPDNAIDLLVFELSIGIPKAEARSVCSEADAVLWDRLAHHLAATPKAQVVTCDRDD